MGIGYGSEGEPDGVVRAERCHERFGSGNLSLAIRVKESEAERPPVLDLRSAEKDIDAGESVLRGDKRLRDSGSVELHFLSFLERESGVGEPPLSSESRQNQCRKYDNGADEYFLRPMRKHTDRVLRGRIEGE